MSTGFKNAGEAPEELSTYEIVREAILNKQPIHAFYDGYERYMCPHVIGTKKGVQQCLFYQYAGQSKSGNPVGWKCVIISGLQNIRAFAGDWHTDTNHSKQQTCVDSIDVEVEY